MSQKFSAASALEMRKVVHRQGWGVSIHRSSDGIHRYLIVIIPDDHSGGAMNGGHYVESQSDWKKLLEKAK